MNDRTVILRSSAVSTVTPTTRKEFMVKAAILLLVALLVPAAAGARAHGHVQRTIDPSRFSAQIDNPWFPVRPGTVAVYTGVKDGKKAKDFVTVTRQTKTIAGARCRAISDRLYLNGRLAERTTDWYTQDDRGDVWYFGEQTAELDSHGRVTSTEGTWQAGVDGGQPGIFMPARPRVGVAYRQEYYKGHAEDHFRVVSLFRTVTSPSTPNALLTQEWTPLEPGVIDHKLYVRGIGEVLERSVQGANEHLELVSLRSRR
jgi:hypothetical protein